MIRRRRELVTTNLVVAESHAMIARRAGAAVGRRFLEDVESGTTSRVVWADDELTRDATARWIHSMHDKAFSLTDAVSFEVMRREGIRDAFSLDQDYVRAGYGLLEP